MSSIFAPERLAPLLNFPWELADYLRFVDAQARAAKTRNDLFSDEVPRFEPRPEDLLVALGDLVALPAARGITLVASQGGLKLEVPEANAAETTRLIQAMDGTRTAAELAWQSADLERLLRVAFGRVIFAPASVEALESELQATEITRFPSSPYAVVRPYWENMAAVTRAIDERLASIIDSPERAVQFLRELHVLATMGASLTSFYKPSSPVSDKGVMPGALWNVPARTVPTRSGTLFVSGPRVNASTPAGELYHHLLHVSLGDPEASEPERVLADTDGVEWGRLLMARAAYDQRFAPWFCPPRPLAEPHFARLFADLGEALRDAEHRDRPAALGHAARFHWRFVHLHPFRCANQCLAMSLVNHVLRRLGPTGMPHLILDQLSVRLKMEAYERLFVRAVERYAVDLPGPAPRYAFYREQKRLAFSAMQRIGEAKGELEGKEVLSAHPDEARAALLV